MSDNDRIQPGDLAIIIKSATGKSVGTIVTCVQMDGEHSLFGRMWLVEPPRPMQTTGGDVVRRAHMPEKWLKKIPKDPLLDDEDTVKEGDFEVLTV